MPGNPLAMGMKSNKDLVGTHLLILRTVVLAQWRDKESGKIRVLIVNPTEKFLGTRLVITILHFLQCSVLQAMPPAERQKYLQCIQRLSTVLKGWGGRNCNFAALHSCFCRELNLCATLFGS